MEERCWELNSLRRVKISINIRIFHICASEVATKIRRKDKISKITIENYRMRKTRTILKKVKKRESKEKKKQRTCGTNKKKQT